ncbi:antibiotic biosynthesis monooxygenase [Lacihabitans sp. CCS-44]|nr:antibiotic biosynthesis monooxygenase [Lacihabitans sp. CCS-44]
MILEIAEFDISSGNENLFEEATHSAKKVISQSKGFVSIEFRKCLEKPTRFLAFIKWETLEDHTVGFRESPLFTEWRAILSPYFNSAPVALHYNLI